MSARPRAVRLIDIPGYRLFLAARIAGWIGSVLHLVALPVLVYQLTASALLTGLLAAAGAVPYLLFGLPAGALADRWDARRTMSVGSAVSGVALTSVSVGHLLGVLSAAHVIAAAFVVGVSFVFADAAGFGALPRLVGRVNVGRATASQMSVQTVINIAGPGLAGAMIALAGPGWVVGLAGLGYLLQALLIARMSWTPAPRADGPRPTMLADVAEGMRFIWEQRVVRMLTVVGVGHALTNGAVTALLVVIGVELLGFGTDDPRLGVLYASAAIGSFVGSLLLPVFQRLYRVGWITLTSLAAMAVLVAALTFSTNWVVSAVILAVLNVPVVTVMLNAITVRQTLTPLRLQSRVNTTARMVSWGGAPVGATIGGLVAGVAGIQAALLVCTLGVVAALVVGPLMGATRIERLDRITPVAD